MDKGTSIPDLGLEPTKDALSDIKFNSALLPPYLKRTKNMEELLPWLYLKGISTGDYQEALHSILGKDAPGLGSIPLLLKKASL